MQNHVLAIMYAIVRLFRTCVACMERLPVLPPSPMNSLTAGMAGASADFDSARLDAVSRSLLWGAGVVAPEPVRAATIPPDDAAGPMAGRRAGRRRRIDP